jgi:hypothetical protein
MSEIVRIDPEQARTMVEAGKALLVCAYEDDRKFRALQLEGAISLSEFNSRLPSLPRESEVIFYCA